MTETENKFQRKEPRVGRTLLVKPNDESFDSSALSSLEGLSNMHESQSHTFFLTFTDVSHAKAALEMVRERDDCRVKCSHYKVFFKVSGLSDDSDYNTVKSEHVAWIEKHSEGNVLYYKLYKNKETGGYRGSGDFVVDTKDSFERLMDRTEGGFHQYESESVSCRHYPFRNNRKTYNKHKMTGGAGASASLSV